MGWSNPTGWSGASQRGWSHAAVAFGAWNPSDKSVDVDLLNGDLTAKVTAADGWRCVRGQTSRSSGGLYYFECTAPGSFAGGFLTIRIGVANASAGLTTEPGKSADSIGWYSHNGDVLHDNSSVGNANPYNVVNRTVGVAVRPDVGGGDGAVWFYDPDADEWNGSSSADPDAGIGAFTIPAGTYFPFFGGTKAGAGFEASATLNVGASPFVNTKPATASAWG